MGFLALYYQENFPALNRLIKNYRRGISANSQISTSKSQLSTSSPLPCPVTAADSILYALSGHPDPLAEEKLKAFYQKDGGFLAVNHAPCADLLSTGVALYALNFINADIRLIKPQCISFVDDLYDEGGFRATQIDFESDVEYTFYGLLALGSLK